MPIVIKTFEKLEWDLVFQDEISVEAKIKGDWNRWNEKIKPIIDITSILTMVTVLFGMIFCFPFLWSALLEDLVGAGFPFVGESILFGCGLISLTLDNKKLTS